MNDETLISIPHLTTALRGSLEMLEKHFLEHQAKIETWFKEQWKNTLPPIYGSVDLRNSGFKLAPVDMNLFPAGFNNLNPDFMPRCIKATKQIVKRLHPEAKKILLIPENHTRNLFYLKSLNVLREIIFQAGFEVQIGLLTEIKRQNNRIVLNDFDADFIWLNNDLSSGIPDILKDLEQPIYPPVCLGWSNRLKSNHFMYYQLVAEDFSKTIGIDAWLVDPLFRYCPRVDFMKREGMDCLIENSKQLFDGIRKKYEMLKINKKPFIVVKADQGTYGVGVMTVYNYDEFLTLNRKRRLEMSNTKAGKIHQVILQEGVYTFETWQNATAEPVVYMIGSEVIGGFYRVHHEKSDTENLNSPGMHFERLAFAKPCHQPDNELAPDACVNRFYAYSVVARLSLLAAAKEK